MQVKLKKYARLSPGTFGLYGRKRIAIIRAAGAISGSGGGPLGGMGITADQVTYD